ncbi:hypothetical protein GSY74_09615 [Sulfurovum sp. bin170]|uniref:hypothetical protein n=1 Tax=Sulfurovum sp. bin170 TaxID=2695268 RepID=UPI0013E0C5BE|nr:hypothetical protein [Sulfurovum sp. bin170]NEW61539.1 hypothetical protein [Sulfurovum sp. bin170]
MRNIFVGVFLILSFFGCGGGDSPSETEISIQIPTKIDVEIPKVITIGDDEFREYLGEQEKTTVERIEDENYYKDIKPITWTIEKQFDETKFNISIANRAMDKIEEYCKDISLNKVCKIPKETLKFLFDKQIVDELTEFVSRKKISNINAENLIGKSLYFGSIEFVHYDENSNYEYSLMMDNTDIENMFFSTTKSESYIRTIKWSKENYNIFYSSLIGSDRTTLYYENIPNRGEYAHLSFFSFTEAPFMSKSHIFDLSRENNSSDFLLKISMMDLDKTNEILSLYRKNSSLQISEERGYCVTDFLNIYPEFFYKDDQIVSWNINFIAEGYQQVFDNNGTNEASRYCPKFSDECEYDDTSTWSTNNNLLVFDPFDKLYFRELDIYNDKNLTDGEYFLLPPEQNITDLTMKNVLKHSVASFIIVDVVDIAYGFIYGKEYAPSYADSFYEKMDSLQVVRAKYSDDLNLSLEQRVEEFEVVKDEDRPKIY